MEQERHSLPYRSIQAEQCGLEASLNTTCQPRQYGLDPYEKPMFQPAKLTSLAEYLRYEAHHLAPMLRAPEAKLPNKQMSI